MLNKEVISGVRILGSTRIITAIIAFTINVIIVRTVSKLEYGNYQLSISIINFWSFLSLTDLNVALIRAKEEKEILSIRNFRIVFSIIAGTVAVCLMKVPSSYYLVLIPFVALYYMTTKFNTILLLNENYVSISRAKLLVPIVFFSTFWILKVVLQIDINLLPIFLFATVSSWLVFSLRKVNLVLRFNKRGSFTLTDESKKFVLWSVLNTMFLLLMQNIDKWAVTILMDVETLSVYMVGLSFARQLNFIFKDTLDALTKSHVENMPLGIKDIAILFYGTVLGIILAIISYFLLPKIYGLGYEKSALVSATVLSFLGVYILVSVKSQSILFNAGSDYKKYFGINILTAVVSAALILGMLLFLNFQNPLYQLVIFALLVPLNDIIRLVLIKKIYII
jgi:O-antigen/teichoic acid export membrane protein